MRNSYKFYIFAFLVHINNKIYSTVKIYIILINEKIYISYAKKSYFSSADKNLMLKFFDTNVMSGKKYEPRV